MELPPFQRLLDEHGAALYRFLYFKVGPFDAGDCYQETMVSALRAYPDLKSADNLRAWLFTIAHNKVIDRGRSSQRRPVPVATIPEQPAAAVDVDVRDDELWSAVKKLPDGQRDAVLFRFVGDLTYADVGATLGCTEAAARQRVKEGIAKLREAVK
ncbi:MAG TPA: sigma-70 family RNA polymerase sigma factor [Acidimicrobiales bacterium]|nr:sigma-70 family RNA polymerase sigma factor [Acidimicrobiales bacterium]